MRGLTSLLLAALLLATVFYWVAKFGLKSPSLSVWTAWAMVILGVATLVSAFLRDRGEKKERQKGE
ncbi:MAG: hypothetical protein QMC81_08900 [Thermoanaerobacterales bacterium]|nr:hypothetical protein [Thermoanaerobacterales bacterium]